MSFSWVDDGEDEEERAAGFGQQPPPFQPGVGEGRGDCSIRR
jgi:hypothetical protein